MMSSLYLVRYTDCGTRQSHTLRYPYKSHAHIYPANRQNLGHARVLHTHMHMHTHTSTPQHLRQTAVSAFYPRCRRSNEPQTGDHGWSLLGSVPFVSLSSCFSRTRGARCFTSITCPTELVRSGARLSCPNVKHSASGATVDVNEKVRFDPPL